MALNSQEIKAIKLELEDVKAGIAKVEAKVSKNDKFAISALADLKRRVFVLDNNLLNIQSQQS